MIKIDFEKFNEIGLKPIIKEFEKEGLPVAGVEGTNVAKRESGFLCKTAIFEFESGQKLHLKAKADGGIFQVKLNAMTVPIKNVDDLDKAVKEVIAFVEKNEATYLKRKQKELEKIKVKVPTIKSVRTSTVKQTEQMQAALATVNETVAETEADKADIDAALAEKRGTIQKLQAVLNVETAITETLQTELDRLQEAA